MFAGALEETPQRGEDHAILLTVGRFLTPDDVLQGRDSHDDPADVDGLGTLNQVRVSRRAGGDVGDVESTESGAEIPDGRIRQRRAVVLEAEALLGRDIDARVESVERVGQEVEIQVVLARDDIHIDGGVGRSMDSRGEPSYEDEVDAVLDEYAE
jgi:hypothetical protein